MICENCGQRTARRYPCPCGLGPECPIRLGVCAGCRQIIDGNAAARWLEPQHAPAMATLTGAGG